MFDELSILSGSLSTHEAIMFADPTADIIKEGTDLSANCKIQEIETIIALSCPIRKGGVQLGSQLTCYVMFV